MTPSSIGRRGSRPRRSEVEGFLAGVQRRLELRRREGPPSPYASALLVRAEAALESGQYREAAEILEAADAALDADEPELALREYPRGLVGVQPRGDPGVVPTGEEERESNRLALASRLASLRRSEKHGSDEAEEHLRAAAFAYRIGDRAETRARVEAALRLLDQNEPSAERPRRKEAPGERARDA